MIIKSHNHLRYDEYVIWNSATGLYDQWDGFSVYWLEDIRYSSCLSDYRIELTQDTLRRRLVGADYVNENDGHDRAFADDVVRMFDDGVITSIFDLKIVPVYYISRFSTSSESRIGCEFSLAEPILECL